MVGFHDLNVGKPWKYQPHVHPKNTNAVTKTCSPRRKKGCIICIYKGFGNYQPVPFIQHYSFTSFRGFRGSSRRLFKGTFDLVTVCIMCHHSSIFVSHDLLLHSDSKTHRWANHHTGEIHPQSHDRDMAKTKLSYLILNQHCQSWNLQFIQFIPSQTCQARGQQPHFILFLDTSPFAASNATALHRAVGNEVEVLMVPKALPPMEEPLQHWLQAPEVAEAISKMLGNNDQKIGGDEAAWFWRFFLVVPNGWQIQ